MANGIFGNPTVVQRKAVTPNIFQLLGGAFNQGLQVQQGLERQEMQKQRIDNQEKRYKDALDLKQQQNEERKQRIAEAEEKREKALLAAENKQSEIAGTTSYYADRIGSSTNIDELNESLMEGVTSGNVDKNIINTAYKLQRDKIGRKQAVNQQRVAQKNAQQVGLARMQNDRNLGEAFSKFNKTGDQRHVFDSEAYLNAPFPVKSKIDKMVNDRVKINKQPKNQVDWIGQRAIKSYANQGGTLTPTQNINFSKNKFKARKFLANDKQAQSVLNKTENIEGFFNAVPEDSDYGGAYDYIEGGRIKNTLSNVKNGLAVNEASLLQANPNTVTEENPEGDMNIRSYVTPELYDDLFNKLRKGGTLENVYRDLTPEERSSLTEQIVATTQLDVRGGNGREGLVGALRASGMNPKKIMQLTKDYNDKSIGASAEKYMLFSDPNYKSSLLSKEERTRVLKERSIWVELERKRIKKENEAWKRGQRVAQRLQFRPPLGRVIR